MFFCYMERTSTQNLVWSVRSFPNSQFRNFSFSFQNVVHPSPEDTCNYLGSNFISKPTSQEHPDGSDLRVLCMTRPSETGKPHKGTRTRQTRIDTEDRRSPTDRELNCVTSGENWKLPLQFTERINAPLGCRLFL